MAQCLLGPEEHQRLVRSFHEVMEPFVKQAIALRVFSPSRWYVWPDGSFSSVDSPEQEEFNQRFQELSKLTAALIFGGIRGGMIGYENNLEEL